MGCDIHGMMEAKNTDGYYVNRGDPEIGRNYEMFAVLANVRNSYDLHPIDVPRGKPGNMCEELSALHEAWEGDAHSHSWVTLKDLKNFDLRQEFNDSHLVLNRDETGKITETCAGTTGEHMGLVGHRVVFGLWGLSCWLDFLCRMELAKLPGNTDDDVRYVFFFDN
jgi:hypothetical protein